MVNRVKSSVLLEQLDSILASDDLKANTDLKKIFLKARLAVEREEGDTLSTLSNDISWYLVTNRYKAPKAIIEFAQQIAKEPHKERGKLALLQMLAMSLGQG